MAFGSCQLQTNKPPGRSGFTLHTVTSFHRPELQHYYGFICHLTSLRSASSFLLNLPIHAHALTYWNNIRLPRLRRIPGEQSHPQAHYGADQVSGFALFWTLTLPQRPNQVCLRYVLPTSYRFLQTLSLPTTPLRFGLSSP
jgi:hypothetical protein